MFIICLKIFDFRYTPEKSSKFMFAYNSCKMVLEWRDIIFGEKSWKKKMPSRKHTLKEREKNSNHDASKCRKIADTLFRKTTVTEWVEYILRSFFHSTIFLYVIQFRVTRDGRY